MNRYNRKHTGSNVSPVFTWLLLVAGIVVLVFRIRNCRENAKALHQEEINAIREKQERPAIPVDSLPDQDSTFKIY